jgi:imidazolonepropionase-like amidohydrolase
VPGCTIEAGKLADLVVLNSDPLKDICNLRDIPYVMKGGVLYPADQILDRDANP